MQKVKFTEPELALETKLETASRHLSTHLEMPFEVFSDSDPSFSFSSTHLMLDGLRIVTTSSSKKVQMASGRYKLPSLILAIEGRIRIVRGKHTCVAEAGSTAVLVPANYPVMAECDENFKGMSIAFEPEQLERHALKLLNLPPNNGEYKLLSLNSLAHLPLKYGDHNIAEMLTQVLATIEQFKTLSHLLDQSTLATALHQVMAALLLPDHVFGDRKEVPVKKHSAASYRIEHVLQYIDDNLCDTLTLRDVRRACNISARALQYAFRIGYDMTPNQWIQERKLLAVRAALISARPGVNVTTAAVPFFGNLGDFARRYRARFGELPSTTLARRKVSNLT